jgi:hypothetical protein
MEHVAVTTMNESGNPTTAMNEDMAMIAEATARAVTVSRIEGFGESI